MTTFKRARNRVFWDPVLKKRKLKTVLTSHRIYILGELNGPFGAGAQRPLESSPFNE